MRNVFVDDTPIFTGKVNVIATIGDILICNRIGFTYEDDTITTNDERGNDEIENIVRTEIPFSILILQSLVDIMRSDHGVIFAKRKMEEV